MSYNLFKPINATNSIFCSTACLHVFLTLLFRRMQLHAFVDIIYCTQVNKHLSVSTAFLSWHQSNADIQKMYGVSDYHYLSSPQGTIIATLQTRLNKVHIWTQSTKRALMKPLLFYNFQCCYFIIFNVAILCVKNCVCVCGCVCMCVKLYVCVTPNYTCQPFTA